LSFGGSTATVSSSHSETDLAWDAVAGADVALGEHVSLGGRYQFVWIDSGSSASGGGVTGKSGNFGAHVVTAQATYRF
jgi:opacity protein-like surface antigen